MYPTLFGQGEWWSLPSYYTMLMVGFLVGVWLLRWQLIKRKDLPPGITVTRGVDLAIALLVMGVLGARVAHVLFDGMLQDYINLCVDPDALGRLLPNDHPCTADQACVDAGAAGHDIGPVCRTDTGQCVPEQDCFRALKIWNGGLTYYGGFVMAFITALWLTRRWKWPFFDFADMASPGVAIGLFFGRMGCYLSGCCFGEVCHTSVGIHFPKGSDAWDLHLDQHRADLISQYKTTGEWSSLPVHPTQLYEAGSMIFVFALLWFFVRPMRRFKGEVTAWLLILYGVVRFTIEFWRADQRGGAWLFSTSQWISFPLIALGLYLMWWGLRGPGSKAPIPEGGPVDQEKEEDQEEDECKEEVASENIPKDSSASDQDSNEGHLSCDNADELANDDEAEDVS